MGMDHIKVLKRAWEMTWRYRALWIFGVILALTTARGWGGGGGNGNQAQYRINGEDLPWSGREFELPHIPPNVTSILIAAGVGLACGIVILIVVTTIARYVAETALIQMVDDYEDTGEKRNIRGGFRLGWSRTAFRLFLIKLLTSLPVAVAFILLFALSLSPLLLWVTESSVARIVGTVAAIGLFFMVLFLAILVAAAISLLLKFFWRACALEEMGVIESIRQGFGLVRQRLKDVGIMWLIMVGVQIGWVLAMIAMVIVLFPAIILLIILGGVLGGLPALLTGGLISLLFEGPVPWVVGALVGLPIFILVVATPWLFLGGLMEVFKSIVWTLTYRELHTLEGLETEIRG